MCCNRYCVSRWWRHVVIVATPVLLLLPLFLIPEDILPSQASQCLYVMLLMAVYWCTEVTSMAVTGLIPIFTFPMLGLLTPAEVSTLYMQAIVMMFIGSLMVAFAVEKCDLHRRIALSVLHVVGTKPLWLMFGFMITTSVLSMWISNTAATAMMLPIAEAIIDSLSTTFSDTSTRSNTKKTTNYSIQESGLKSDGYGSNIVNDYQMEIVVDGSNTAIRNCPNGIIDSEDELDEIDRIEMPVKHKDSKTTGNAKLDSFAKGITLVIAYSANIGGTATLAGTPINAMVKGYIDGIWQTHGYNEYETNVNFTTWLVFGMPVALASLVVTWLWLTLLFNGCRSLCPWGSDSSSGQDAAKSVIDKQYRALGKIRFSEVTVSVMFLLMVFLWFFRSPGFMTGWGDLDIIKPGYSHDSVVSISIAFILCLIPSEIPRCGRGQKRRKGQVDTLLDWNTIQDKFPWGVLFLIGGGFSLAKACTSSGLSMWIAGGLAALSSSWPGWLLVFVFSLLTTFLTDVMSNTATSNILMPIVGSMSESVGYSPLYLMLPVGVCSSFSFMLPVGTAPNAISFSYGRISVIDMVKSGFLLNIACACFMTACMQTWAFDYFQFDVIPWSPNIMNLTSTISP